MYFLASRISSNNYAIDADGVTDDWHKLVDDYEPIDFINGEVVIYNEQGHKYLIGPEKALKKTKLFWKVESVDVGSWDFEKGEPFLIDTNETRPDELRSLLIDFAKKRKMTIPNAESTSLKGLLNLFPR